MCVKTKGVSETVCVCACVCVCEQNDVSRTVCVCVCGCGCQQRKSLGLCVCVCVCGRSRGDTDLRVASASAWLACLSYMGSEMRLKGSCITHIKAHGPSRTCNESEEEGSADLRVASASASFACCVRCSCSVWRCSATQSTEFFPLCKQQNFLQTKEISGLRGSDLGFRIVGFGLQVSGFEFGVQGKTDLRVASASASFACCARCSCSWCRCKQRSLLCGTFCTYVRRKFRCFQLDHTIVCVCVCVRA